MQIALATIAVCGMSLSICTIVSYLPPVAGYSGGIASILSLIALALSCISGKRRPTLKNDPSIDEDKQIESKDLIAEQSSDADSIVDENTQTAPTHIFEQLMSLIPDELYTHIFKELNGRDLTRASQVCKRWGQLAGNNHLWENLCFQESIAPEERILNVCNYHQLYWQSMILKNKIKKLMPNACHTPVRPNIIAFLKTKDCIFLYADNYPMSFEMWDSAFKKRLFSKVIDGLYVPKIKRIGKHIYLTGRLEPPSSLEQSPHVFYVYEFVFKEGNLEFHSTCIFEAKKHWHMPDTQFELGYGQAFIGNSDGTIDIIDMESEGIRRLNVGEQFIHYYEQSTWNEAAEQDWLASFAKKEIKIVNGDYPWEKKWLPIRMEEGEYERLGMQKRRDNHLAIQKRKQLSGHSNAITATHCVDHYLFSSAKDGILKKWDLSNNTCVQTIDTGFKTGCSLLKVAGRYVFGLLESSHKQNMICQWDFITKQCLYALDLKKECLSFQVNGNVLFCACKQEKSITIEIYDLNTKEQIKTLVCSNNRGFADFFFENDSIHFLDRHQMTTWDFSSPH